MSSPKGYPSSLKSDRLTMEHSTVEPVRKNQNALSVLAHQFVQEIGSDATEAGTTIDSIKAMAHSAQTGDVILIAGREIKVQKTTVNDIFLVEPFTAIPSNGTAFTILRHKYPKVNASGELATTASIESGPVVFVLDGVDTEVSEDTVTPVNSNPLPTKDAALNAALLLMSAKLPSTLGQKTMADSMAVVIASDQSPLQVEQLDLNSANDSVTALQGGTWSVDVANFPATQAVSAAALPLPAGAATETTLSSLNSKVTACNTGAVVVTTLPTLPAGTNNIGDVDVLSLPPLPAGSNLIGAVQVAGLTVVDFMDTPVLIATSTNIPGSGGSALNVVATLAAATKKIRVADTTGEFIGLYVGATLAFVINPGMSGDAELAVPAGSAINIKSMGLTAIAEGNLCIQFLG